MHGGQTLHMLPAFSLGERREKKGENENGNGNALMEELNEVYDMEGMIDDGVP
jgi:hypothetical protein